MRWKNLIILFVITSVLGVVLTMYSCNVPQKKERTTKDELAVKYKSQDIKTQCTVESCNE